VVLACMPLAAAGLVVATPDAPLLACLACGTLALLEAVNAPPGSRRYLPWWALVGAALGFALISKYTAIFLPLGVVLAFLLRPSLRRQLRMPGPWLACAVSLLVFLPVVAWNSTHDWISFVFQLHHGLGADGRGALSQEVGLLEGQAALASPILLAMMGVAAIAALRRKEPDERFLLGMMALAPAAFFVVSALRKPVAPNWTAPAYIAGIALLAAAGGGRLWRGWLKAGCAFGGLLVLLVYLHGVYPVMVFGAYDEDPVGHAYDWSRSTDPIGRAYGWDGLASRADAARNATDPPEERRVWVAADNYEDASELSFHMEGHPFVFSLNVAGRPNQYDYWPQMSSLLRPGDGLVLVLRERKHLHPALRQLLPRFESFRKGDLVEMRRGREVFGLRRVWILEGWRGERTASSDSPACDPPPSVRTVSAPESSASRSPRPASSSPRHPACAPPSS
ncbi:MAG TPA: glycosyltransferase family 39 protein, partial [Candidatus Saccharimonadales bacterium]|nr:glycosyltransferase family 39 protein [Candidatus Saccharimonadales bacterium]